MSISAKIMLFVISISSCLHCIAAEIIENPQNNAEVALRGMEDSIQRINSGICKITGRTIKSDSNGAEDNFFIVFDYSKKNYRFENLGKAVILFTPDRYYELLTITDTPTASTDLLSEATYSPFVGMVDIQALPWYTPIGPKYPFDFQNEYKPKIFIHKLLDYKKLSDELLYLKFDMVRNPQATPLQFEYWLSPQHDYLPVRQQYSAGFAMDISWQKINSTWVPISYLYKSDNGMLVEWTIDWEQVNEPVPPKYFDPEQLSVEPVPLYSSELGEMLQIGFLGKNANEYAIVNRYYIIRVIIVAVGLFLIFICLVKLGYHRLKKSQ